MQLPFFKYHGAGNDFIILHQPDIGKSICQERIELLCNRRFGIGADGLIVIERDENHDFYMRYYNADGKEATMCGNGGRCAVAFAREAGYFSKETTFMAADGLHYATFANDGEVRLQMQPVTSFQPFGADYYVDTGSPHLVKFLKEIDHVDVYNEGRKWRYHEHFTPNGTNVNFTTVHQDTIRIRTYERGVENETLACGTGAVASAVSAALKQNIPYTAYTIEALGGKLSVDFRRESSGFYDVFLKGPVKFVFSGIFQDINKKPDGSPLKQH